MTCHPWLAPSAAVVAKVARARATAVLRRLATVPAHRLGRHATAWDPLLAALPALLRSDSTRLLDAVGRVDVLSVLIQLADGPVDATRLERALVTLWLAIAGHPGLISPLALPGPFREQVVDPCTPRLLALGNVRGLIATAHGPLVISPAGRFPIDEFLVAPLPAADGTVILDEHLDPPDREMVARVTAALAAARSALPGGRLERVTIGAGDAAYAEARVGPESDPGDLVASAQAAFIRAAAAAEPVLSSGGMLVEKRRRLAPVDVLARACGNAVALPWRANHAAAARTILDDLDDLTVLADPTPTGAGLVAAIRAAAGTGPIEQRRALLVNVDADDFVYSFLFGQSVERRCVERGLRVDRIVIDVTAGRDLAGELGQPVPLPVADGTEFLVASDDDPALAHALRHLSARPYEVIVGNVRPRLFYDLVETGMLRSPTLLWDRHLHDRIDEERARRGAPADAVRLLPIQIWSLLGAGGAESTRGNAGLAGAGFEHVTLHAWPMDLAFFQPRPAGQPDRVFVGGDSGRDWPVLVEAIRDLPISVHLVTARPPADLAPAGLAPRVRFDTRLPLWRFRDALAAAAVTAIPVDPESAYGLTVLTMAMALGVAVVATRTAWMTQYATDGEEALLVPPGDAPAFRAALVRLLEDADLRARLVANARRRVAALCDLEAFTREMFATLD